MTDYNEVLDKMDKVILAYYKSNVDDGNTLNNLLKDLSTSLYYMETIRSEVHNNWQIELKRLVKLGSPVNRAENEAHILYPEMYKLRHIMKSAYDVVGALRTNISYMKAERNAI